MSTKERLIWALTYKQMDIRQAIAMLQKAARDGATHATVTVARKGPREAPGA